MESWNIRLGRGRAITWWHGVSRSSECNHSLSFSVHEEFWKFSSTLLELHTCFRSLLPRYIYEESLCDVFSSTTPPRKELRRNWSTAGFQLALKPLGKLVICFSGLEPLLGEGAGQGTFSRTSPARSLLTVSDHGIMIMSGAEKWTLLSPNIFPTSIIYGINFSFDTKRKFRIF